MRENIPSVVNETDTSLLNEAELKIQGIIHFRLTRATLWSQPVLEFKSAKTNLIF